ncbi:hypothetical protein D3C74_301250 [compost metagenome]
MQPPIALFTIGLENNAVKIRFRKCVSSLNMRAAKPNTIAASTTLISTIIDNSGIIPVE